MQQTQSNECVSAAQPSENFKHGDMVAWRNGETKPDYPKGLYAGVLIHTTDTHAYIVFRSVLPERRGTEVRINAKMKDARFLVALDKLTAV